MRTLLIYPRPSGSSPQKNPPLSILYPGEAAAKQGFDVKYWDARFDDDLPEKIDWADTVAISSMSGYQLGQTLEILRLCQNRTTILGGVHPTLLPKETLASGLVNHVIAGEGEWRFPELLKGNFNADGVNGHSRTKLLDLDTEYVSPVSKRTERYFKLANQIILPSARGCPRAKNSCSFCPVGIQHLCSYRIIPFELWCQDMEMIYNLRPFSFFAFEDENSLHLLKHKEYIEWLAKKGIKYRLHLRADSLKKESDIMWLKRTGCKEIFIGVESGSERVRNKILNKGESDDDFLKAAKLLNRYNIEAIYSYMIGIPGETRKEMVQTLNFSDRLRAKSRASIYVLVPLPGTIFAKEKKTVTEWSKVSAADNPDLPADINSVYLIGGLHHNRLHKTKENFPGLWRLLILPLEILCEIRWQLKFFKFFGLEKFLIEKLLAWKTKRRRDV